MVLGENGIFGKANWAKFVNGITQKEEAANLIYMDNYIDKIASKNQIATTSGTTTVIKIIDPEMWPIKGAQLDNDSLEGSLKETIELVEGIAVEDIIDGEIRVQLYEIDNDKINVKDNERHIINIVSGKVYKLNAFKYKGKSYHRPEEETTATGTGNSGGIGTVTYTENGDYQFAMEAGSEIEIVFTVPLTGNLIGQTPTITCTTTNLGKVTINGTTAKITADGTTDPRGPYEFEVAVGGQTKPITVTPTKFLEDPEIEVTDITYESFKINITNNYPAGAGVQYKYYVTKTSDSSNIYTSSNYETVNPKDITNGIEAATEYDIRVEIYLPNQITPIIKTRTISTINPTLEYAIITENGIFNKMVNGVYSLERNLNPLAEDAIGVNAFDGNDDTSYNVPGATGPTVKKYIMVDPSARGKTIHIILRADGTAYSIAGVFAIAECDDWKTNVSRRTYITTGDPSGFGEGYVYDWEGDFVIPQDCMAICYAAQEYNYLYEIKLVN